MGLFWLSHFAAGSASPALIGPLLTIGAGISLPWGLMDGLAVSVVPKERAGMATGIFSTTRVAGEGVALAVVSAVLSAFIQSNLGTSAAEHAATTAQRLVTGDLSGAAANAPAIGQAALIHGYSDAFSALLWLLTGITAITAIVVFSSLGRGSSSDTSEAANQVPDDDEALTASEA